MENQKDKKMEMKRKLGLYGGLEGLAWISLPKLLMCERTGEAFIAKIHVNVACKKGVGSSELQDQSSCSSSQP